MPQSNEVLPRPTLSPDVARIQRRRQSLMVARQAALARRDFAAANEFTRRLVKLPVPIVRHGVVVLDYGF